MATGHLLTIATGFLFLPMAFAPLAGAQAFKPFVLKRTLYVTVGDNDIRSDGIKIIEARSSNGSKVEVRAPKNGLVERTVILADGTTIKIRDSLKIKTTTPGRGNSHSIDCRVGVLGTEVIHGIQTNKVNHRGGLIWAAPSLNCTELRRWATLPSEPGKPVTKNRIETDSIELQEPPVELFLTKDLEELAPSEFAVRVMRSNKLNENIISRTKQMMKSLDEQYYRLRGGGKLN